MLLPRLLFFTLLTSTVWAALPARFEANRGQSPEVVLFLARGDGQSIFLTKRGATFHLTDGTSPAAIELQFDGAGDVQLEGDTPLPGIANYFLGNDPKQWVANIPTFARVRYRNVYPGIDVVFYTIEGNIEFDWILAPQADPKQIHFSLHGTKSTSLEASGDLIAETTAGNFTMRAPAIYQQGGRNIGGHYTMENGKAGVSVGNYNRSQPLVIDPVIAYHARIGTRQNSNIPSNSGSPLQGLNRGGASVQVDRLGNSYICGSTLIADFPTTVGAVQPIFGGLFGTTFAQNDVYLTKISPDGKNILYSTYLGGNREDTCLSMALDAAGNAYVAGYSNSTNFSVTSDALQTGSVINNFAGFVTKISPTGSSLIYSTVIAGNSAQEASSIAVDSDGNAYIAGLTFSSNFPTTPGAYKGTRSIGFNAESFALKLNPAGSKLVYSTLLGPVTSSLAFAVPRDTTTSIAVDSSGNAYVGGTSFTTNSLTFPTTQGAFQTQPGALTDGYILKLNADGSNLVYSTYLGGQGQDGVDSIAVDSQGQVVAIGHADSTNFPTTANALWPTPNPEFTPQRTRYPSYGFVAKLNATGTALVYSSYIGGGGNIVLSGVALDVQNNIHIVGSHDAPNFPVTADAIQHCIGNSNSWSNAVLMKLSAAGDKLLFATYLGGNARDQGLALAVDRAGAAYITGMTDSIDFAPTPGAISDPLGTTFVTKIDLTAATPSRIDCIANTASMAGGYVAPFELVTIQGTGIGPKDTASTIVKDGLIDTTILNTRVLFDGTPAPLVYVSPNRINAIVPGSVSFRTSTKVQVEQAGQLSSVFTIPVASTSLSFFTASGQGVGQAAAINQDGTANSPANPAARGSVVSLFINGYGVINSETSRPAGQVATDSRTINAPSVQIGSFNGIVTFAGYVPGFTTSLLQLNVRVPANGNIGPNVPIFIFQATPLSSQRVFLAVK